MSKLTIATRGAKGLNAAEVLFLTPNADGDPTIPEPTGEALATFLDSSRALAQGAADAADAAADRADAATVTAQDAADFVNAVTGDALARPVAIQNALGFGQVFSGNYPNRVQLTFSQLGDFTDPRRSPAGITAGTPDAVFGTGRVVPRTATLQSKGYVLEPGTTGFCAIIVALDQSNGSGATSTGGASDAGAAVVYNVAAPSPRLVCFNGGIAPLQAAPSAVSLGVVLSPASIASVVPARQGLNPFAVREDHLYSVGLTILNALPTTDRVFLINMSLGSTSFADREYEFQGSRVAFTASIDGTTMTVATASSNNLLARPKLIVVGAAAGTHIVRQISGTAGGAGEYEVSVAQTLASTSLTTRDQKPQPLQNLITAVLAAANWARANGLTPVMPWWFDRWGEAESDTVAVANGLTTYANHRSRVNEVAALIGQTIPPHIILGQVNSPRYDINHDPASNENNNSPSLENMGRVSNMALAALEWTTGTNPSTGLRYDTNCSVHAQYDQDGGFAGTVHFTSLGHLQAGDKEANIALDVLTAPRQSPFAIAASRTLGSSEITVTMSEPVVVDTTLVSNPGQWGVGVGAGGVNVPVALVAPAPNLAAAVTGLVKIVLSEPSLGVGETVSIACDNAPLFVPHVSRAGNGTYPFDPPFYGLGREAGQRSNLRARLPIGHSLQSGRPIHLYAAQQRVPVKVSSGKTLLADILTDMGVVPTFAIDANDPACYPGSGQTVFDRSAGAANYNLGVSNAADATDPAWAAKAGAVPGYFGFDGGDSLTPVGAPTFADNLHKTGARFVLVALVQVPATMPAANQYFLATMKNETGGGAGIALRLSTAGRMGITVRDAANGVPLNVNSAGLIAANVPTLFAIGVDTVTPANGWYIDSPLMTGLSGGPRSFASAYSNPSAGAAEGAPFIGKNWTATDLTAVRLANGTRLTWLAVLPWQTAASVLRLYETAKRLGYSA